MYLKRLELAGFKSFAAKTELHLEPGVSAVVGPNGAGKSNIADAIRWVLGEQSPTALRLKKHEELVFAGTDKRPRASFAEARILLDNASGRMPVEFSEVEISRRLYRSGESEYRLNGRKVRLLDLQQLLAQAGFGLDSYAVIGQGTIDNLVLASPADRKLLFSEASGIREHELKRDQAVRKLQATERNLQRLGDIMAELAPRLQALERSAEAAREREQLQTDLQRYRSEIITAAEVELSAAAAAIENSLADNRRQLETERSQEAGLAAEVEELNRTSDAGPGIGQQLRELELERDQLVHDISLEQAQLQHLQDRHELHQALKDELARIDEEQQRQGDKLRETERLLKKARADERGLMKEFEAVEKDIAAAQRRLNRLREQSEQTSRQAYVGHALDILKQIAHDLQADRLDTESLKLLIYKAGRLLKNAHNGQQQVSDKLRESQNQLAELMQQRDGVSERNTEVVIRVRSLEMDIQHQKRGLGQLAAQSAETQERLHEEKAVSAQHLQRREEKIQKHEDQLQSVDARLQGLRQQLQRQTESGGQQALLELGQKLEATRNRCERFEEQLEILEKEAEILAVRRQEYRQLERAWKLKPAAAASAGLAALEKQAEITAAKIELSREADTAVLNEHREVRERHDFMSGQLHDLKAAKEDIATAIGRFDGVISEQFESAFSEIGRHFNDYFRRLFGGGESGLQLEKDEEGNFGIEIYATPPGKRAGALSALSGGERSLAGIALLAAILQVNPSPFVVMDEVDAALDEANSGRFAQLLQDMGVQSQLIVITHNHETMGSAGNLYGVTMDEDQVSQLLSLKLEKA